MSVSYRARAILAAGVLCAVSPAVAAGSPQIGLPQHPAYPSSVGGPDMLGTTAVSIRAARFSGSWAHAMQDASRSPLLQQLIAPARGMGQLEQLAYVQSRVHNGIRWISDATEWGQHDYWASASETLAHGAGDMEDRAIVKMQALRALGFRPGNLFLTMARDRVGGPITVLTVRINGRYYILDDTGGAPFLVDSRRREFQPVLSFGLTGAWVHTRTAPATTTVAVRAPASPRTTK
jgi:predicted transglutaminase-like cysteine proteinase